MGIQRVTVAAAALVASCASNTINMSVGSGKHELGPEDTAKWESSKDSQSSSDSIKELSSKISGVDKSQNEIKRSIDKTSQTQQQMEERNEVVDRLNKGLPKHQRRQIYKDGSK